VEFRRCNGLLKARDPVARDRAYNHAHPRISNPASYVLFVFYTHSPTLFRDDEIVWTPVNIRERSCFRWMACCRNVPVRYPLFTGYDEWHEPYHYLANTRYIDSEQLPQRILHTTCGSRVIKEKKYRRIFVFRISSRLSTPHFFCWGFGQP